MVNGREMLAPEADCKTPRSASERPTEQGKAHVDDEGNIDASSIVDWPIEAGSVSLDEGNGGVVQRAACSEVSRTSVIGDVCCRDRIK